MLRRKGPKKVKECTFNASHLILCLRHVSNMTVCFAAAPINTLTVMLSLKCIVGVCVSSGKRRRKRGRREEEGGRGGRREEAGLRKGEEGGGGRRGRWKGEEGG